MTVPVTDGADATVNVWFLRWYAVLYCILYIHCPKNNLNLCFMTVPVMDGADATVNVWFLRWYTVLYLDGLLVMLNAHGRRIKIKEKAKVVASVFILLLWLCWSTALHILFCTQRHCTSYNSAILDFFKSKDKKRRKQGVERMQLDVFRK